VGGTAGSWRKVERGTAGPWMTVKNGIALLLWVRPPLSRKPIRKIGTDLHSSAPYGRSAHYQYHWGRAAHHGRTGSCSATRPRRTACAASCYRSCSDRVPMRMYELYRSQPRRTGRTGPPRTLALSARRRCLIWVPGREQGGRCESVHTFPSLTRCWRGLSPSMGASELASRPCLTSAPSAAPMSRPHSVGVVSISSKNQWHHRCHILVTTGVPSCRRCTPRLRRVVGGREDDTHSRRSSKCA